MEITPTQFAQIEHCLPLQRGNVSLTNLQVLNAVLYVAEHGCKWRGLPRRFGNWHTIYTRMNRWAKSGVLDRAFKELQRTQVVQIKIDAVSLDSTSVKVHPDGTGALKKTVRRLSASPVADGTPTGCPRGTWRYFISDTVDSWSWARSTRATPEAARATSRFIRR
jgi:transposase